jgi:hypothetical protein
LGPKGEEVPGSWKRLQNKELHKFYASRYIIREEIDGHVARIGVRRKAYNFCLEYLKGRNHSEYLGIDVRKILEGMVQH